MALLDAVCVVWHCFSELCKCYSSLGDVGTSTARVELLLSGTRDDPQRGEMSVLMCASTSNIVDALGDFFLAG